MKKNLIFFGGLRTLPFFRKLLLTGITSLFLLCSFLDVSGQQQINVTGKLTDSETKEPMPGVNVQVKGTTIGAISDINGNYAVTVPGRDAILVFSFIGYLPAEVPVAGRAVVDLAMVSDVQALEEVVVVGYGVQKKTSMTASVATMDGKGIASIPVSNIGNTLGGRISGLITKQASGDPGRDESNIYIRGRSSTGSSQPLTIVDGVPRDFKQLDPNTIESFSVLKDAAAVAAYGVAGANGVILVTTKKGITGAPQLTYNASFGVQNPTVLPNTVNGYQYASLQNAAADAAGRVRPYSDETLQHFLAGDDPDRYPDPNYRDMINRNNPITKHNIEIRGGTETVRYYGSLGYQYQEGMWKDNDTRANRFNFSLNLDADVTKTTKINFNFNGRKQDRAYPYTEYSRFWEILLYTHTEHEGPMWFSNGMPGAAFTTLLGAEGYDKTDAMNLYSQISIDQEIPFIKGLKARALVSYDPSYSINKIWNTPRSKAAIDVSQTPYVITQPPPPQKNSLTMDLNKGHQMTYQAGLTYDKAIGKSNFSFLTLMEAKTNTSLSMGIDKRNYDLSIDEIDMGSANLADQTTRGSSGERKQIGFLYRLIYDYDGKYLFETSARYDGNFYFAPGKRFGFFPAVSAGWRISEESFMQSLSWLNNLKIRASYGEVGALAGSAFQYLSTYAVYSPATTLGGLAVQGINERSESNPEITWERARKSDLGFDIGLFKGLVNLEVDYFYEKRSNMLVSPDVVVPSEYGIGLSQVNAAIMSNQGVDMMLQVNKSMSSDLDISFNANFTFARNKLIQIFETSSTFNNPNRKRTGRSYNTQFGLKAIGYFGESDFNDDGSLKEGIPTQPWEKLQPGDIRYADMNGDGKIDESNDQTEIGKPESVPEIIYGFGPDVRYKDFTLSLLFQGVSNTDMYLTGDEIWPFYNGMTAYVQNFDYWSPDNRNARFPRITSTRTTNNSQTSSWWIESGAYLRLKTIMLAYDLPSRVATRLKMHSARITLSGENLFTITKLENWDPETGSNRGENVYPMQKVIAVGLNIGF